ncbi:unnamed protein product, partial [Rotaria magnacalcarata]
TFFVLIINEIFQGTVVGNSSQQRSAKVPQ